MAPDTAGGHVCGPVEVGEIQKQPSLLSFHSGLLGLPYALPSINSSICTSALSKSLAPRELRSSFPNVDPPVTGMKPHAQHGPVREAVAYREEEPSHGRGLGLALLDLPLSSSPSGANDKPNSETECED